MCLFIMATFSSNITSAYFPSSFSISNFMYLTPFTIYHLSLTFFFTYTFCFFCSLCFSLVIFYYAAFCIIIILFWQVLFVIKPIYLFLKPSRWVYVWFLYIFYIVDSWTTWVWNTQVHLYMDIFQLTCSLQWTHTVQIHVVWGSPPGLGIPVWGGSMVVTCRFLTVQEVPEPLTPKLFKGRL